MEVVASEILSASAQQYADRRQQIRTQSSSQSTRFS